jgi:5-formyltetrahydrofolate cyclo-ligase
MSSETLRVREAMSRRIVAMSRAERNRAQARIVQFLVRSRSFAQAPALLGYIALADEVDVGPVLQAAHHRDVPVYLPCVADRDLRFRRWLRGAPLQRGVLGVMEPHGPTIDPPGGVCLVPGRCFDLSGARLGRGGGYYDRLLMAGRGRIQSIGVAYACQVVPAVATDPWDQSVDALVTEDGWLGPAVDE